MSLGPGTGDHWSTGQTRASTNRAGGQSIGTQHLTNYHMLALHGGINRTIEPHCLQRSHCLHNNRVTLSQSIYVESLCWRCALSINLSKYFTSVIISYEYFM